MLDADSNNLPNKWWHYDFGDQLWAWHIGAMQTLSGPVQLQAMDVLWRQQLQKRPLTDQEVKARRQPSSSRPDVAESC